MNDGLGLLDLPTEILQKIFFRVPNELRQTCRTFVVMYNDHYMNLFIDKFGPHILRTIAKYDFQYLIDYIKSFDYWRKNIRMIISRHYELKLPDERDIKDKECNEPNSKLNCQFIRDSWKLIYGIYMNRRIFVEYDDYRIDSPSISSSSYVSSPMNTVNTNKKLKLTPGLYNLSCGMIIKNYSGMSSTIFRIYDSITKEKLLEYQPVSHFAELVPSNKFVLLDMGSFEVRKPRIIEEHEESDEIKEEDRNKLIDIKLEIEESGVTVKSGYILCYVDINAYQLKDYTFDHSINKFVPLIDKYWIAWWIENQVPKPENVVNILLKRLYKSMEKSMDLITVDSPHKRMGSFAESDNGIELEGAKVELNSGDSENSEIDIETYNQKFYSPFNEDGEVLVRQFKFRTNKDRMRYNEWIESSGCGEDRARKLTFNEPLKWKLSTIMEL